MQTPKTPTNFYLVRKDGVSILRWDRVLADTLHQPIVITKYRLERTSKTNNRGWELVVDIVTPDVDGFVDSCWVETWPTDPVFYRLSAFGPAGEQSDYNSVGAYHWADQEDPIGVAAIPTKFFTLDVSILDGPDILLPT